MKQSPRLSGLLVAQPSPHRVAGFPRRHPTGAGGHPMQDRPVQRRVDDLVVVGHVPPSLNTANLSQTDCQVTFDREPLLNGNAR